MALYTYGPIQLWSYIIGREATEKSGQALARDALLETLPPTIAVEQHDGGHLRHSSRLAATALEIGYSRYSYGRI